MRCWVNCLGVKPEVSALILDEEPHETSFILVRESDGKEKQYTESFLLNGAGISRC